MNRCVRCYQRDALPRRVRIDDGRKQLCVERKFVADCAQDLRSRSESMHDVNMLFATRRARTLLRETPQARMFRQLSETILEFGTPLLRELPDGVSLDRIRDVLGHVIEVWNALVLAEAGRSGVFRSMVQAAGAPGRSLQEVTTLTRLAHRRAESFAHDQRMVVRWSLQFDPVERGGLRLVAQPGAVPLRSEGWSTHNVPAN